jgi:hypothetical protein
MVEIGGPELPTQQDSDWQQIEGGQLRVDTATASGGNSGAFGATVLGQRYLTEVAMQGAMRDGNGVLRNGAGKFTVEIEGLPQSSQNVLRVDIEPLVFGIAPFSSGAGEAFQQYQPTGASAATMNLEIRRHDQSSQEVFQWWNETTESGGDRRLVTVDALDRNGQAARTWQFFDCFPISYSPFGEFAPGAMVSNEVLSLNCNRAEFDIAGSGPRRAMVQWLNGYSNGQDTRRDVSIVEMLHDGSEGATYFYGDSLPTMYRFPQFDATRSDNLMEEIHFVPATLLID